MCGSECTARARRGKAGRVQTAKPPTGNIRNIYLILLVWCLPNPNKTSTKSEKAILWAQSHVCLFVYFAGGCKATPGINRKAPFHPMWCHTEGCRRDQELWFFLQSAQSDSLPISSSKAVIVKLSLVMYVSSRLSICNCQSDTHIFILSGIE